MNGKELVKEAQDLLVAFREFEHKVRAASFDVPASDERLSHLTQQLTIADCKICVVFDQLCSLVNVEVTNKGKIRSL